MGELLRTTQTTKENDEKSQGRNRAEQDDDDPGPPRGRPPPGPPQRTSLWTASDSNDAWIRRQRRCCLLNCTVILHAHLRRPNCHVLCDEGGYSIWTDGLGSRGQLDHGYISHHGSRLSSRGPGSVHCQGLLWRHKREDWQKKTRTFEAVKKKTK